MSILSNRLPRFRHHEIPVSGEMRWRFRFSLLTVFATLGVVGWGGFVTSIDAGLAVPDWPATFGSYDPFMTGFEDPDDPAARWWHATPILAEHGHRLLGALVGLLTLILAFWTWRADPRRWMRVLGFAALALVIIQGVMGGLRVVWLSLNLAVVHAVTAQIFVSLLVGMTLFTSTSWLQQRFRTSSIGRVPGLQSLAAWTLVALFVQIFLGALLRHPGLSVDPVFAAVHIAGAFIVTGLAFACFAYAWRYFDDVRGIYHAAWGLLAVVVFQFMLGMGAYIVILYEAPLAMRSVAQVVLTVSHVVVGSLLVAASVCFLLLTLRRPEGTDGAPGAPLSRREEPTRAGSILTEMD